jgi:hypothetical protein
MTRREMLTRAAGGFGAMALGAMGAHGGLSGVLAQLSAAGLHHRPRAKNVIFLYMDGGPSQVDTFDPKPRLTRDHGKAFPMKIEATQFDNNGAILGSPWTFRPGGTCGLPVSDLFPHIRKMADELCVVRSMTSKFSEHTAANYFLHTGAGIAGRPSMGAWLAWGLGSESKNLPDYVVLNGGLTPPGGLECFGSGFLPPNHQATRLRPHGVGVSNVAPSLDPKRQRAMLALVEAMDDAFLERTANEVAVESAIANHEMAFRMQASVPELMGLEGETDAMKQMYGLNETFEPTRTFGRECLLARRLVERGVRFIELTCPVVDGDRWDQHNDLRKGHTNNALAVDQPIAALLRDLRQRGLMEDTLVVWTGEFGRTPFAQGTDGRDHNPFGFSSWLAGAGVRGGTVYGETDEFGYRAIDKPVEIHDLHATMLHLLGIDHTQLTMRVGGRDHRLTDVHGHVIRDLLS